MAEPIRMSAVLLWNDLREGVVGALRSLVGQVEAIGGEVIVVTPLADREIDAARASSPGVRWVRLDPPPSEPLSWEAGVLAARGAIVAFGQARCRYAPGWAEAVLAAGIDRDGLAAGPVLPHPALATPGKAAYLCDYGPFADPEGQGGGGAAANNVAFAREALRALCDGRGLSKAALLAGGAFRVGWVRGMSTTSLGIRPFRTALRERFHRGRQFASWRAGEWSRSLRGAAGLGCLALPAILFVRLIRMPYLRRHFARTLTLGSPWIAASLGAWSLGEMVGYWTGPGGRPGSP